jgi:DNA-binding protein HU-beta
MVRSLIHRLCLGRPARPTDGASSHRPKPIREPIEGNRDVNKSELIEHIANQADISKAAASRSLEALIGAVKTTLKKGGSVTITGFGTFTAPKRAARTGRNPRTGAAIKIKAAKVPKFRPGKGLRDAL